MTNAAIILDDWIALFGAFLAFFFLIRFVIVRVWMREFHKTHLCPICKGEVRDDG